VRGAFTSALKDQNLLEAAAGMPLKRRAAECKLSTVGVACDTCQQYRHVAGGDNMAPFV
jgi:hypothetical protein